MRIISQETRKAEMMKNGVKQTRSMEIAGKALSVEYVIPAGGSQPDTSQLVKQISVVGTVEPAMVRTTIDVENGKMDVPVLYDAIYEVHQNVPGYAVNVSEGLEGNVVFLRTLEAEEVKFGTVDGKNLSTVPLPLYTAALELSYQMLNDANMLYSAERTNRNFGRANNALKNHAAFLPFITKAYAAANKVAATTTGVSRLENLRLTLEDAWNTGVNLNELVGDFNVLLIHPSDSIDVQRALNAPSFNNVEYGAFGRIDTLVEYKGWSGKQGKKTYAYPGVTPGKAYLVRPKGDAFHLFLKEDGLIKTSAGDMSRLVEELIVAITALGIYAQLDAHVIEVTLP